MTGDQVLFGELEFFSVNLFPPWVHQPHTGHNNEDFAYVRMPHGLGLIASLVPFYNGNNPNIHEYRCFIKTQNNTVFAAFLQNNNNALHFPGNSRVFLRIFGEHNPVYSGILHHADGQSPAWLP